MSCGWIGRKPIRKTGNAETQFLLPGGEGQGEPQTVFTRYRRFHLRPDLFDAAIRADEESDAMRTEETFF